MYGKPQCDIADLTILGFSKIVKQKKKQIIISLYKLQSLDKKPNSYFYREIMH